MAVEVRVFEPDPAHICIRNAGKWSLSMNPNMFGRVTHIRYLNEFECDLINGAIKAAQRAMDIASGVPSEADPNRIDN
jgi:hypothetical protein